MSPEVYAILKCLEEREVTLRRISKFSSIDTKTISEKSVKFFATLGHKVDTFRELKELDEELASKYNVWLENGERSEEEVEEDETDERMRPSRIDDTLCESSDARGEAIKVFREIKLKFPRVEQVEKYLGSIEVVPPSTEKSNKLRKMLKKVKEIEQRVLNTEGKSSLIKDRAFLSQIESDLEEIAEDDIQLQEEQDMKTAGEITKLQEMIQKITEEIARRLEEGDKRERQEALVRHMQKQKLEADLEFGKNFPAMTRREKDEQLAWKVYGEHAEECVGNAKTYKTIRIRLNPETEIKNEDKTIAVRVLSTGTYHSSKDTKTLLLVGMTGTGKSTLLDALINYIHDVRYEDEVRLRLVSLTEEEEKKQDNQARSQTDHITVYKIKWVPGMNIDYNITLIDTPGMGDTRGLKYDKERFHSMQI